MTCPSASQSGGVGKSWTKSDARSSPTANTEHGTPVFVSGDAVSWNMSLGLYGALGVIGDLRRSAYKRRIRGERLYGPMTSRGRHEMHEGWGLRLPGFVLIACNAMRAMATAANWETQGYNGWLGELQARRGERWWWRWSWRWAWQRCWSSAWWWWT